MPVAAGIQFGTPISKPSGGILAESNTNLNDVFQPLSIVALTHPLDNKLPYGIIPAKPVIANSYSSAIFLAVGAPAACQSSSVSPFALPQNHGFIAAVNPGHNAGINYLL